ncbi:hypothetical protein SMICM17S_07529 [Streptomyces microflavus]
MPAGPVPTTATRMGAKSEGRPRSKVGSPQAWKFGPAGGFGLPVLEVGRVDGRVLLLLPPKRLSTGKIASTGQASAQAPESMQVSGST